MLRNDEPDMNLCVAHTHVWGVRSDLLRPYLDRDLSDPLSPTYSNPDKVYHGRIIVYYGLSSFDNTSDLNRQCRDPTVIGS